ncbi:Phosphoribosylanthranilate isomerase [Thermocrinis albus DSM 14484]|uniref:N-(5'-phosphoribosyl)anthranilate isomerase n=1 Tax=Thermocrinis albus (strain DSM 14484 / JCM 11386 / HI 11/12) TaxID=638303 RepID=D3SPM6_THEAH|nr:phosphoribosylanthranilate isomerase [Thermocrinis albus]ADC89113.1 Phosphoribosylanthranilate isomerase [Thermocrinis albus DSM 14484]
MERKVKVKFCGLTREEDVVKARELCVSYVGFVMYPKSPRYVSKERLKELITIAGDVLKVAVVVNLPYEDLRELLDMGVDLLQLHGDEDPSIAFRVGMDRVIKAFRVKDGLRVDPVWREAHAVLLDTHKEGTYGGTGETFNWDVAVSLVRQGYRIILSGGLTPQNVGEAIKKVKPYGVDVSSGIELSPGVKDHKKMEEFCHAVENP